MFKRKNKQPAVSCQLCPTTAPAAMMLAWGEAPYAVHICHRCGSKLRETFTPAAPAPDPRVEELIQKMDQFKPESNGRSKEAEDIIMALVTRTREEVAALIRAVDDIGRRPIILNSIPLPPAPPPSLPGQGGDLGRAAPRPGPWPVPRRRSPRGPAPSPALAPDPETTPPASIHTGSQRAAQNQIAVLKPAVLDAVRGGAATYREVQEKAGRSPFVGGALARLVEEGALCREGKRPPYRWRPS